MKAINNFGFPINLTLGERKEGVLPFDGRVYDIPDEFYDKYHPILHIVQMPKLKLDNVQNIDLEELFSAPDIDVVDVIAKKPRKKRSTAKVAKRRAAAKKLKESKVNRKTPTVREQDGNNNE